MQSKKKMTQEEMILQFLRAKPDHCTTSLEIALELFIVDGRKRISVPRRKGYRIIGTPITKTNKFGYPVTFNKYTLVEE